MKKITVIEYSNTNSLISAIVFLILGIILFTNPGGLVEFISYIIGGFLIVVGLINLIAYSRELKKTNISNKTPLTTGIILVTIGIIAIFASSFIETLIRFIAGAWILYSGVIRLINAINNKEENSFIARLVIAILLICAGFYTIFRANLVFSTIGLLLVIYSVLEIVGYIFYSKK